MPSCLLIQDLAIGIISQCEQFLVYTLLHLFCHVLLSILQVPFSQKICTLTPSISYSIRQYKTVAKTSLKIFQSFFYLNMDAKTQFIARLQVSIFAQRVSLGARSHLFKYIQVVTRGEVDSSIHQSLQEKKKIFPCLGVKCLPVNLHTNSIFSE